MSLKVLDAGSLPAGAINEDAWGVAGACAWVLDGATGLGRNVVSAESDAAWFAHALSAGLERRLRKDAQPLSTAIAGVLAETAEAYDSALGSASIESYELPSAAGIFAEVREQDVALLWLGDCRAYWRDGTHLRVAGGGRIDAIDDEGLKELAAFFAANPEAGLNEGRAHVWPLLRRQRTTMNQEHGYWAWAPQEGGLLQRAEHCTIRRGVGPLLLASDGFTRLWDTFAIAAAEEALDACSRGQGLDLVQRLRSAESDDASGREFVRFKQYDDCTWLCLEV